MRRFMTMRMAKTTITRTSRRSNRPRRLPAIAGSYNTIGSFRGILTALILAIAALLAGHANAHPEDDICGPDSGLDPQLCAALSGIERDGAPDSLEALVEASREMGFVDAMFAFFVEGWTHVFPDGVDHLLFMAALFLSTRRIGSLVAQVSAFTVAHTFTVGLTAAGIITPSPSVIEPLISASIVLVAVEAMVFREPPRWRVLIVFLFGLVHGMGFARAFSAASHDGSVFWPGLLGFNIGVELAQLLVGAIVFTVALVVRSTVFANRSSEQFRMGFTLPASVLIGLAGLWYLIAALSG